MALISVIIPCYNQANYLQDAINSVCCQSYRNWEIVVINDGSTDDTASVVEGYPQTLYFYQENSGLSAARNTGIQNSSGSVLVFLDADDRLTPDALQVGLTQLQQHPDCGFISGHHRYIDCDGKILTEYPPEPVISDRYKALLMNNYIGMHATVMYQRSAFDKVGVFDTALPACEDYEIYLRIAHVLPVYRHPHIVAEYRQHGSNMSRDSIHMARTAVSVLERQRPLLVGNAAYKRAYRIGVRNWVNYYGGVIFKKLKNDIWQCRWRNTANDFEALLRFAPFWLQGRFRLR